MLDATTIEMIKKILFKYLDFKKDKAFIFGSRATGNTRKFSDIDIGVRSEREIDTLLLSDIEEAFEESNIPYTVDVVDFSQVRDKFKQFALKNIKLWKTN